ncbi:hypothetical protein GCM10023224_06890 [Streptomonospora halophila]|uniref:Uncharacterized protein n=1 Tax=Streptomonospora halophila TaxID=427369 RepID=A0ABP9GCT0_9ACTN
MTAAEHPAKKVKSAGRALEIVDFVAERGSVTFQDVVDSGLPKSRAGPARGRARPAPGPARRAGARGPSRARPAAGRSAGEACP